MDSGGGILLSINKPEYNLDSKTIIKNIEKYCGSTLIKPTKKMFSTII